MELKERIKRNHNSIKEYQKQIEYWEKENKVLEKLKEPSTVDLFNGIEKYFVIQLEEGEYNHILGGDGRSQPWSETRKGLTIIVQPAEGIYLNGYQKKTIKDYIKKTSESDSVVFKEDRY
jgi:hypothetical protein